jgi:hypothetical protein
MKEKAERKQFENAQYRVIEHSMDEMHEFMTCDFNHKFMNIQ